MSLILAYSGYPGASGLSNSGIDRTILALHFCMGIVAAAQTRCAAPRLLRPLRVMGQRSYETYLTHIFVAFARFPIFFWALIRIATALGVNIARLFSGPINHLLRRLFERQSSQFTSIFLK
jgi:peptidoglycan/LPS O-acetylase OafA/YrhL